MNTRVGAWTLAALALGVPARGSAQVGNANGDERVPAAGDDPDLRARKRKALAHFDRGLSLGAGDAWSLALAEFRKSREIYPTRVAWINEATCLQHLQRAADALEAYDEIQRTFVAQLTPDETQMIAAAKRELGALVAELFVTTDVADARIWIDERERGPTPQIVAFRVDAGRHVLRLVKAGFDVFEVPFEVAAGRSLTIRAALTRATPRPERVGPATAVLTHPLPRERSANERVRALWLEASAGPAFAASLAGDADQSCDRNVLLTSGEALPGCASQSRPSGIFAGIRAGYRIFPGFSLEVLLGYVELRRSLVRRLAVHAQDVELSTENLQDELKLQAPLAAIGASYGLFEQFPLVFRLSLGVARGRVKASDQGEFAGLDVRSSPPAGSVPVTYGSLKLEEDRQTLLVPFVAPEVRFGVRVRRHLFVSVGIAAWAMFAPARRRTGDFWQQAPVRRSPLQVADENLARTLSLPNERALGTWLMLIPSLGLGWET